MNLKIIYLFVIFNVSFLFCNDYCETVDVNLYQQQNRFGTRCDYCDLHTFFDKVNYHIGVLTSYDDDIGSDDFDWHYRTANDILLRIIDLTNDEHAHNLFDKLNRVEFAFQEASDQLEYIKSMSFYVNRDDFYPFEEVYKEFDNYRNFKKKLSDSKGKNNKAKKRVKEDLSDLSTEEKKWYGDVNSWLCELEPIKKVGIKNFNLIEPLEEKGEILLQNAKKLQSKNEKIANLYTKLKMKFVHLANLRLFCFCEHKEYKNAVFEEVEANLYADCSEMNSRINNEVYEHFFIKKIFPRLKKLPIDQEKLLDLELFWKDLNSFRIKMNLSEQWLLELSFEEYEVEMSIIDEMEDIVKVFFQKEFIKSMENEQYDVAFIFSKCFLEETRSESVKAEEKFFIEYLVNLVSSLGFISCTINNSRNELVEYLKNSMMLLEAYHEDFSKVIGVLNKISTFISYLLDDYDREDKKFLQELFRDLNIIINQKFFVAYRIFQQGLNYDHKEITSFIDNINILLSLNLPNRSRQLIHLKNELIEIERQIENNSTTDICYLDCNPVIASEIEKKMDKSLYGRNVFAYEKMFLGMTHFDIAKHYINFLTDDRVNRLMDNVHYEKASCELERSIEEESYNMRRATDLLWKLKLSESLYNEACEQLTQCNFGEDNKEVISVFKKINLVLPNYRGINQQLERILKAKELFKNAKEWMEKMVSEEISNLDLDDEVVFVSQIIRDIRLLNFMQNEKVENLIMDLEIYKFHFMRTSLLIRCKVEDEEERSYYFSNDDLFEVDCQKVNKKIELMQSMSLDNSSIDYIIQQLEQECAVKGDDKFKNIKALNLAIKEFYAKLSFVPEHILENPEFMNGEFSFVEDGSEPRNLMINNLIIDYTRNYLSEKIDYLISKEEYITAFSLSVIARELPRYDYLNDQDKIIGYYLRYLTKLLFGDENDANENIKSSLIEKMRDENFSVENFLLDLKKLDEEWQLAQSYFESGNYTGTISICEELLLKYNNFTKLNDLINEAKIKLQELAEMRIDEEKRILAIKREEKELQEKENELRQMYSEIEWFINDISLGGSIESYSKVITNLEYLISEESSLISKNLALIKIEEAMQVRAKKYIDMIEDQSSLSDKIEYENRAKNDIETVISKNCYSSPVLSFVVNPFIESCTNAKEFLPYKKLNRAKYYYECGHDLEKSEFIKNTPWKETLHSIPFLYHLTGDKGIGATEMFKRSNDIIPGFRDTKEKISL